MNNETLIAVEKIADITKKKPDSSEKAAFFAVIGSCYDGTSHELMGVMREHIESRLETLRTQLAKEYR